MMLSRMITGGRIMDVCIGGDIGDIFGVGGELRTVRLQSDFTYRSVTFHHCKIVYPRDFGGTTITDCRFINCTFQREGDDHETDFFTTPVISLDLRA
jgi:hypothetical protein